MHMCTYLENKLLDHVLRNIPYTPPSTLYVALLTGDPGEAGDTTNEVSDPAYTRQTVIFDEPVDGVIKNKYDIEFPQASEDWGEITHILILDENNNPLFYGPLTTPKTITSDDIFKIPLNELIIQFD